MITLSFDIGIKNLSAVAIEHDETICNVLDWNVLPLVEAKTKVKGIPLEELSLAMFQQLDDLIERAGLTDKTIDHVLIESQPCMKNPTMKSIQMILFSYFMLLKHQQGTVDGVHFAFAGSKNVAQYHDVQIGEPPEKLLAKSKAYDLRKWQSVEYCRKYIQNDEKLTSQFEAHKKKDDLADCLTQAVVWLKRSKVVGVAASNIFHNIHLKVRD